MLKGIFYTCRMFRLKYYAGSRTSGEFRSGVGISARAWGVGARRLAPDGFGKDIECAAVSGAGFGGGDDRLSNSGASVEISDAPWVFGGNVLAFVGEGAGIGIGR